jgi:hypothetical protein
MILLPIVVRELRVAARRKSTYSARFGTAIAAVIAGATLLFVLKQVPLGSGVGEVVFDGLACVGFFYCLTLSSNTADCISEEKREGTLGLLFLTDLSGWDVALGKLCANSIKSFYALLGTFPVVAIVLTLGGVSAGQFCKEALALLNAFFFAHAAGLLASVLTRVRSRAYGFTMALLYVFLIGPPLLLASGHGRINPFPLLLAALSPGYALVIQIVLPMGARFYWISLLMVHLTAWLFLALASWRLPHCWQEKVGPVRLRWRDRFRQWTYGPPAFRKNLRRELAGINPFFWLASRDRLSGAMFEVILLVMGCCTIFGVFASNPDERNLQLVFMVIGGHLCLIGGMAAEASRHLDEQRRSGALEFILCATPLQPGEILAGQWMALRRFFRWPLIFVLAYDLVIVLLDKSHYVDADRQDKIQFDWFMAVALVMLAVDVIAAGWLGMWRAMANQQPKKSAAGSAVAETLLALLLAPFALILLLFTFCALVGSISASFWRWFEGWAASSGVFLGLWLGLALAMAVGLSFLARRQLLTQFRAMAAVQTGEPLGVLGQLGRLLGKAFRRQ